MAGERGYGVMFSPYGSMVLKALIQALSLFFRLPRSSTHSTGCTFDIRGSVVPLLKMSVQSCLDPVGRSSAGYLSHMATKSIV